MQHKLTTTIFIVSMALAVTIGCTKGCSDKTPSTTTTVTSSGGLQKEDIKVGDGDEAVTGKTVVVHYTGTLTDGTKFDSSLDRGTPFTFPLGGHQVIQGWDEGIVGMKVHGKRKLTIPPEMAYGPEGRPPVIPPNSTLVFDVELLEVK